MKTLLNFLIFAICFFALKSPAQFRSSSGVFPISTVISNADFIIIGRPGVTNYNVAWSNVLALARSGVITNGYTLVFNLPGGLSVGGASDFSGDITLPGVNSFINGVGTFALANGNFTGDSSGNVTALTFTGSLIGNATTASTSTYVTVSPLTNNINASTGSISAALVVGSINGATNALSAWPTTPLTSGAYSIVNSNGTVFILTSGLGNTWTATNKIAP